MIATPIGDLFAVGTDTALISLGFHATHEIPRGRTRATEQISQEITAYFAGTLRAFATPLALDGPPFFAAVWRALQNVPFGQTLSYSGLAAKAGNPRAYRAAASACAQNHFLIIVPCHRVLGRNGTLGGFSAGLDRKRYLLRQEKRNLAK